MSNKKTVWLSVPVEIPVEFDEDCLPGFLSKFIDIGLQHLSDSVSDDELETSEEEEVEFPDLCRALKWLLKTSKVVSNNTEWGVPVVSSKPTVE